MHSSESCTTTHPCKVSRCQHSASETCRCQSTRHTRPKNIAPPPTLLMVRGEPGIFTPLIAASAGCEPGKAPLAHRVACPACAARARCCAGPPAKCSAGFWERGPANRHYKMKTGIHMFAFCGHRWFRSQLISWSPETPKGERRRGGSRRGRKGGGCCRFWGILLQHAGAN